MKMRDLPVVLCTLAVVLASSVTLADGDQDRGRKIFNKCKMWHVVGRDAASVPGYKSS